MNEDITTRQNVDRGSIPPAADSAEAGLQTGSARDVRDNDQLRAVADDDDDGFLPSDRLDRLRSQWGDVQAAFVDDPRSAVQQAHSLVGSVVDELTRTFTRERDNLEGQWNSGGNADTEALRIAMQRYRSFFNRLLGG